MDSDFQNLINGSLSTNSQVATYVEIARRIEKEAQEQDQNILGRIVHVNAFVNHSDKTQYVPSANAAVDSGVSYGSNEMVSGDQAKVDAALSQVTKLTDVIVFNFELSHETVSFIIDALGRHSPYKSGRYMHSHVVFADGVLVDNLAVIPDMADTHEYLFVSTLPYARKIEEGESSMAPSGVYEIVALEAQDKYGGQVIIEFIDYTGTYGVMAEATSASHGRRTKTHLNKSENRFPAIRLTFPRR